MKKYYVIAKSGKKGPYPADRIAAAVKRGRIPGHAKLEESVSGKLLSAKQAADSYEHRQTGRISDSGRQPAAEPQPVPTKLGPFENKPFPTVNSNFVADKPRKAQYPQSPQVQQPQQQYPQPQGAPAGYHQAYPQQQPYPQQQSQPQQQMPNTYGYNQPMYAPPQSSNLAVAALVLTLATIPTCIPLCIGGIICGFKALDECSPNGHKSGRGMAMVGIWGGFILSAFYLLVGVLLIAAETGAL